ncbi:diaminopimelate decarboxylase [Thermotalea metallivorans]|uniref:Diaminopimelate decarboxylase n=1 Tax=Thermotalea metallivorans TaxID=520762 RepID=A0A140L7Q7_9FIRM|nr:diaminopimelate decarboxylase [Thermotalea metallivorans]KXG76582.1 Diaminopimelate decarboxylase [Thermotalea metallivorans]
MKLFGTMKVNEKGELEIGGCSAIALAKEFGTPLYVMDENLIRENCKQFKKAFAQEGMVTEVIYASKAFLNMAMCRLIQEEGLGLDVVSGGEMYTAFKAGFPMEKVYFHGNNKTEDELEMALTHGVGTIIVDNQHEMKILHGLCNRKNQRIDILLRVNPGIEAHTHAYIQTATHDSKFGESIYDEKLGDIIRFAQTSEYLRLKGFHCHIGSQIFEEKSFYGAVEVMVAFLQQVKEQYGFETEALNLGGGFGIYYSNGDDPVDVEACLSTMLKLLKAGAHTAGIRIPKVMIEPGRAIVGNAGCTLYGVGNVKETYGGKKYVFVDGGMTDNPRTALYGAVYEAGVANRMNAQPEERVTIAGKCCESGDIIIHGIDLPKVQGGDIICVASTGAYNYTMASNYNRIPRPAVVFVKEGKAKIVVKRETYDDVIRNDFAD